MSNHVTPDDPDDLQWPLQVIPATVNLSIIISTHHVVLELNSFPRFWQNYA